MRPCNSRRMPECSALLSLVIGYDLNDIDDDEYGHIKEYVAIHKKQRHIIQNGTMYKIASPRKNNYAVFYTKN